MVYSDNGDMVNNQVKETFFHFGAGLKRISEYSRANGQREMSTEMSRMYEALKTNQVLLQLGVYDDMVFMATDLVILDRMLDLFLVEFNPKLRPQKVSMFTMNTDVMNFMADHFVEDDADDFEHILDNLDDDPMTMSEAERIMFNIASDFLLSRMDTDRARV